MNLGDASVMARQLMRKHGIGYWEFAWINAKRIGGQCSHHKQEIRLSKPLTTLRTEDNVRNTILHEIAHALVGTRHGHDHVWKTKAIEIGCTGDRCYSDKVDIDSKYVGKCPTCEYEFKRHRLGNGRTYSCNKCDPKKHNPNNLIIWTETKTGKVLENKVKYVRMYKKPSLTFSFGDLKFH